MKKAHRRARRTQSERSEATRSILINAAIKLLKRKRYAGFRLAQVPSIARVSRGAQSHHFHTKDDLVLAALEHVYRSVQERALARIASAGESPMGVIDILIVDAEEFFLGTDFPLTLDLLMVGGEGRLGKEVQRLAQHYRMAVERAWLEALIAAGEPAEDARSFVYFTLSFLRGLGVRKIMQGEDRGLAELVRVWRNVAPGIMKLLVQDNTREFGIDLDPDRHLSRAQDALAGGSKTGV